MMARTDMHLDAMLRHLGAAYYESLHGRATRSDVTRALDTLEEHLKEQAHVPGQPAAGRRAAHPAHGPRKHRWTRRVRDVMTTSVVTVDRITPFKEIDVLLTEHRISGMPVLAMGRRVVGVVSEADLLAVEDKAARQARMNAETGRHWPTHKQEYTGLTAATLMTSPAVTIHPDATIPAAARLMTTHRHRRLPVVDPDGKLIGIVTRRDLLSVFLRPDAEILADARQIIDEVPFADPAGVIVTVRNGIVTLSGRLEPGEERAHDLVPLAIRLIWDVDGVVDVVNRIGDVKLAKLAQEEAQVAKDRVAKEAHPA